MSHGCPTAERPRSPHGWSEEWRHHREDVVSYATYLLHGDVHAAEDAAQEAAVRLWQHAPSFDREGGVRAWLRVVTRNIVIDRTRRRAARPSEVPLVDPGPVPGADDPSASVVAAATVDELLAPLSPAHRDVVLEVYVHDRGIAGAAQRLGLPVGTVKSRCHYALKILRAAR